MPLSSLNAQYHRSTERRYEQGDLLRDITVVEWAEAVEGELQIRERELQYAVVLSQDCDLEHDYNSRLNTESKDSDKHLQHLLLCPAYPASTLRTGQHLAGLNMSMQTINSSEWKKLTQNNLPRYHYLPSELNLQVPDLVVDFKHYVTLPRDVVYRETYQAKYFATIEIVFRDHLSGRFAHYLSRIGLPELSAA